MGAHAAPMPRGGRATAKIAFGESTASVFSASSAILSILIDYNCAVFLISKELLKRCPTRGATLVGQA